MNFLEEKIMSDPIVAEIREHRMNILESYDWDFRKMSLDVMKRQFESGHKVVSFKKRPPQQGAAPNAYAPSAHP
jgi:hypothetical protein